MTDDVKDLLGRALGQEPPLRIDRDEVIQQGRKRLRRRRLFEASGVVAAVVVVAIGAATLTNLADSDSQRMPPAASRTQSAPPGPVLPLPVSQSTTPSNPRTETTSTPESPPSGQIRVPPKIDADQLTVLLYNAGVVSRKGVREVPDTPAGIPAFQLTPTGYVYRADVSRASGWGALDVTVDYAPGVAVDCAALPTEFGDCEVSGRGSFPVASSKWHGPDGENRNLAFTVLDDGTRIAAIASNVSYYDREVGKTPTNPEPVLDTAQLSAMVAKVGIGAR
jgi:hypothetical protein